ncbi:class I SAM-dependent rRNA methyltransferase [Myxococcota bacterium]|nr:class I SAM-dependent rRNA methyltransferase [Myxococcota bacterium]MBU1383133.1 class I SAM-dependent rRNA methyltransferase [Myxococcota bacterium]MBU1498068.1 class I SAM-dependent rRNA methyltransferase [Myxococcota bacterium]
MADKRKPADKKPQTLVRKKSGVTVQDPTAKAVQSGHPWIFRNTLTLEDQTFSDGDMVDINDRNGRFIGRGVWNSESSVALRVVTRDFNAPSGSDFHLYAINRAVARRQSFTGSGVTNAYRLVHAEADMFPGLTITRYGSWLLAIVYTESAKVTLGVIADYLLALPDIKGIYFQQRLRPSGEKGAPPEPSRLYRGEEAPVEFEVMENGLKFLIDITAPMSVGLFPDYRPGRVLTGELSEGRRVLNLFSYTGAFSVYALAGRASEVVSVDINQKVNTKAIQNCEINNLKVNPIDFMTEDAIKAVSLLASRGRRFELAIIDPPTFATGPRGNWSVERSYRTLLRELSSVMEPDAMVLCTANTQKLSMEDFERIIAAGWGGRHATIVKRLSLPEDYPEIPGFNEGNYLKSLMIRLD